MQAKITRVDILLFPSDHDKPALKYHPAYLSEFIININSPRFHSLDEKVGQWLVSLDNSDVKESEKERENMSEYFHLCHFILINYLRSH